MLVPSGFQVFTSSKWLGCQALDEQILIYAQRPDAIAVLEIEKWNNRFGRWVNKGAKGIGNKSF